MSKHSQAQKTIFLPLITLLFVVALAAVAWAASVAMLPLHPLSTKATTNNRVMSGRKIDFLA